MKTIGAVRPSPIAGQWYPADPRRLAAQVDRYIAESNLPALSGEVVAIMAPHAGHLYSGAVAGYSFAAVRGSAPEIVAIVAPMHYPYHAPILTTAHAAYATPLGQIDVDQELLAALERELESTLGYGLTRIANDPEHSLEIELPFLQRVLTEPFRLLPLMIGQQDTQVAHGLGLALAKVLADKKALLVASTDLSHFKTQSVAQVLDTELLRRVEAFDPQGVIAAEEQGKGYACGRGAVAAVLWAAQGLAANQVKVLKYATSGDVTGDYSQVVGYGAAVITRSVPQPGSLN